MFGKVARVRERSEIHRAHFISSPLDGKSLPSPHGLMFHFIGTRGWGAQTIFPSRDCPHCTAFFPIAHLTPPSPYILQGAAGLKGAVGGMARSVVFGDGDQNGDMDDGGAEILLERIADGVLAADRRAAAIELRDLVQRVPLAQFAVGAMGLPTLTTSLREEREDPELMHGVLEALTACIASGDVSAEKSSSNDLSNASTQQPDIGLSVAEAFAKTPHNCKLILSLLDDQDFYTRYHATQLLTALASRVAHTLRGAVMASPTGVAKLMDMMLEREVIRNETLLLLVRLTSESEDLRKIVAFEGAFERCFNIIREEGASDGGVIVRDCLELCSNLLRASISNQVFFRESSFLARLPETIASKTPAVASWTQAPPLSAQKAANLLCALELVTLLVSDGDTREAAKIRNAAKSGVNETVAAEIEARDISAKKANREMNQKELVKAGMLEALLQLCLGDKAVNNAPTRTFALRCLGDLVAESKENQDVLFAAEVKVTSAGDDNATQNPSTTEPALLATLRVALRGEDAAERVAAEQVFARCLSGNNELQLVCVSTFAPVGEDEGDEDVSLGALLARALVGKSGKNKAAPRYDGELDHMSKQSHGAPTFTPGSSDLEISCHAAAVLRHVLDGNRAAQARILSIPLELSRSNTSPPELLLPRLVRYLSAAARLIPAADEERERREAEYGRYGGGGDFAAAEQAVADKTSRAAKLRVERTQATLLRVLIAWLHGCAPAVRAFLAPAHHLPMLADLARSDSPHVAGLACVLLGCCLASGDVEALDSDADAARGVMDVVTVRVGLDVFFGRWEEMMGTGEFRSAALGPTLSKPLTRVTANKLASSGVESRETDFDAQFKHTLYDTKVASFIQTFEQTVKERVIGLYARPKGAKKGGMASAAATWEPSAGETPVQHVTRLKGLLRSHEAELEAQRARNAVLAERLMTKGSSGGGDADEGEDTNTDTNSGSVQTNTNNSESVELAASLERARLASEEELRNTKAELAEALSAIASSEENLRGLSQAYNGLESEMVKRDEENAGLLEKLEAVGTANVAPVAPVAPDPAALAAAREEGRRTAIAEMAQQLEETEEAAAADVAAARRAGAEEAEALAAAAAEEAETEMSDMLTCLGQEESKVEALMALLIEKHGENEQDLEAMLEEVAGQDEDKD